MKKKMSKAISILLVSLMLVAMFPVAFAADEAQEVTVSMLASGITTTGVEGNKVDGDGNYTIAWNDNSAVYVKEESKHEYFRTQTIDGTAYYLPAGGYNSAKFTFKTKIADDGYYTVSLTPIMAYYGATYEVYVDGQCAGTIESYKDGSGWASTAIGDEVELDTLKLSADAEGYVEIMLKNVSTSYADAYVNSMAFKELKLTPFEGVFCTGITENITDRKIYVGKTVDFKVSANMSDDSTFFFDSSDTAVNNITAEVTSGDSVELSDVAIGDDGNLHGKIKGLAETESTITVTVKLGEETGTYKIKVTPKTTQVTVSMLASNFTTSGITNNKVTDKENYTIAWSDNSAVYVKEESNHEYFRTQTIDGTAYCLPAGGYNSAKFTFKTKIADDGYYTVSLTPIMAYYGATYEVYVDGQCAGTIESYKDGSGWGSTAIGDEVELDTLKLSADAEGYVEIMLKNVSTSYKDAYVNSMAFKELKLTPFEGVFCTGISENITDRKIYVGETVNFEVSANMSDDTIFFFDGADTTTNNITAEVTSGNSVELSDVAIGADGNLHGKIKGLAETESTITVTVKLGEETGTYKIKVAPKMPAPATQVTVSMLASNFTTSGTNFTDGAEFTTSDYSITWNDGSAVFVKEESSLRRFHQVDVDGGESSYAFPAGHFSSVQFTFKTKITADGYYTVSLTPILSQLGGRYGIWVNDQYAGSVNSWNEIQGVSGWRNTRATGDEVVLNTLKLSADADGYVTIKLKNLSTVSNTTIADSYKDAYYVPVAFREIKLTPTAKFSVTAETVDGDVDGLVTATGYTQGEVADVSFGEQITLTANNIGDYKFLYWMNLSNNMYISEEATLNIDVISNMAIAAVYTKAGNTRYDYFTSSGQRIASCFGSAPEVAPEIPAMIGYTSGGEWTVDNSYETDDYVAYAPDYTNATPLTFETEIDGEERTVTYDDEITVTAEEADFSYWAKDGKTVSYDKAYTFFVWGSETVEKVLNGALSALEKKPSVVLFKNGNDYMLELVGCEGVEVIEKGILFSQNGTPTIGSTITKAKSNSDSKQFTASSSYAVARAYLVYRDDEGVKVVYSK